jgi:hypothetical protein
MKYVAMLSMLIFAQAFSLDCIGGDGYLDEKSLLNILQMDTEISNEYRSLSDNQRVELYEKAKDYKKLADAKFREAETICLLFPYNDQQEAMTMFKNAISISIKDRNFAQLIRSLIIELSDYGLTIYPEWSQLHSLLREAEFNYEVAKSHLRVVNSGKFQFDFSGFIGDEV